MNKLGWIAVSGLVVIACTSAGDIVAEMLDSGVPDAGAQPTPAPTVSFAGYTSEGHRLQHSVDEETGGMFQTYAACQAEFGETARICATAELLGTLDLPPPPAGNQSMKEGAWVAETLGSAPACWQTISGSDAGTYLTPAGFFLNDLCGTLHALACCTVD